jgi:hypothetical protein
VILALTACKKNYTCICTIVTTTFNSTSIYGGTTSVTKTTDTTFHATKKNATKDCNNVYNNITTVAGYTCAIDMNQ